MLKSGRGKLAAEVGARIDADAPRILVRFARRRVTVNDDRAPKPFTIGRVIHSSRSVGFTGWIGGVAVFDRALGAGELVGLANLNAPVVPRGKAAAALPRDRMCGR